MKKRRREAPYREPKSQELRDRNDMMRKDRMMGCTFQAIAAAYGVSRSHAHRIACGIPIMVYRPRRPPKSRKRPERAERFHNLKVASYGLRKEGFSYQEIARQLGIGRSTAFLWCRRVKIRALRGNAWLSHAEGKPKEWKQRLREQTPA